MMSCVSNGVPCHLFDFLAVGALTMVAGAAELRVPDDFATIQAALDAAATGDEIIVYPGTYYESIDFLGKAVYLHSSDGAAVTIIDATGLDTSVVTCASGEGPDTVLEGFTVTGGVASYGGGVCCENDSGPTLKTCTITGNSVTGWDMDGGGVCCYNNSSPTLTDCTITDNTAPGAGGGVSCGLGSNPTLTDCTIRGNTSFGVGGGVCCYYESSPALINCAITDNTALWGGGVFNLEGDNPTVTNCTFIGNSAYYEGGGMYNAASNPTVTNCTFIGNSASIEGGGMYNGDAPAPYASNPTVTNCILWANTPTEIYGDTATVTYSDVQGGFAGTGNIDADPLFVDPANGNFRLQPGSPCIDAGDNTALPDWVTTDLDGNPRFVDDPDSPDTGFGDPPIVDMGAYEYQVDSCPADFDGDGDVDTADLLFLLGAWGTPDGDVDGDNDTDTSDLLALLAAWGECP